MVNVMNKSKSPFSCIVSAILITGFGLLVVFATRAFDKSASTLRSKNNKKSSSAPVPSGDIKGLISSMARIELNQKRLFAGLEKDLQKGNTAIEGLQTHINQELQNVKNEIQSSINGAPQKPTSSTDPPIQDAVSTTKEPTQSRYRKFISYTPSKWEKLWLDNVDNWTKEEKICQVLIDEQMDYVRDFLNLTCTSYLSHNWCKMDDSYRPIYYNLKNTTALELRFKRPAELGPESDDPPPTPIRPGPQHEHLVSKFVFLDETTNEQYVEYIEPLVSHLRHPLSKCENGDEGPLAITLFRGYVIPPPQRSRGGTKGRQLYFDAGSSSWTEGGGGPSLSFFTDMWQRHGIEFDRIQAYEMTTPPSDFYQKVPPEYQQKTIYRQCPVASSPDKETLENPFIPHDIERIAKQDDYVFFKLDIDSPTVEDGSIQYILDNDINVDEVAWEHHVFGNYLMRMNWATGKPGAFALMSLEESYGYFLRMRMKGIRAHSWI